MITLNILRDVLLDSEPYDGIDRLIREELASGQSTKAIHDEIFPLVKEVRKTPGFTENSDEALLGALDALTSNCHPDCQYRDPPELPMAEEIATLPRQPATLELLPSETPAP